ncbi:MAG: Sir2 histone deacetylase Hst2 [Geoglossum umbratile]|nr:MAG: Sir2 histone deacetylase Hst2 [Geoglossum umbratile]
MGQESSSRPKAGSRFDAVKFIKEGRARRIVVLTGAGISTSAGIPDFRSPETGLYANLARLNLPYPEAVFDLSFFRKSAEPFYALAHELYPGKFRPTITHFFIRLLSDKGLLFKLFTQNIDCLEREAGVPDDKIVEAHGSFARQSCIECKSAYPDDMMKEAIQNKDIPHCLVPQCNGLVKPDIIFFGEQLPQEFLRNVPLLPAADLCIVMGTSLSVHPFASLPSLCSEGVPRILINLEQVGGIGSRPNDVVMLGDCDAGVRKLAAALGWLEELEALWETVNPKAEEVSKSRAPQSADEELEAQVDKLTREVDIALKISSEHTSKVQGQLTGGGMEKRSSIGGSGSPSAKSEDGDRLTQEADASQADAPQADAPQVDAPQADASQPESRGGRARLPPYLDI